MEFLPRRHEEREGFALGLLCVLRVFVVHAVGLMYRSSLMLDGLTIPTSNRIINSVYLPAILTHE